jgi:hypothetical protein
MTRAEAQLWAEKNFAYRCYCQRLTELFQAQVRSEGNESLCFAPRVWHGTQRTVTVERYGSRNHERSSREILHKLSRHCTAYTLRSKRPRQSDCGGGFLPRHPWLAVDKR